MNEDLPELPFPEIPDEVPGAISYKWDPVNKVWIPIFNQE